MAVYEAQAQLIESADAAIGLLLNDLDLSTLTPDQRVSIQDWHKGIQQASNAMRFPE
jgi:hypothetical protein